ncbi:uncharacterized protein ATNIH1004_011286 [Aspergillus tanneri]|uniref:DUF7703 domain-containing protein n=1 Tax=Aspergillus tanneri TaxID=1220188 RepID=A0A5M9M5L8_9EURO|nr:uncharacterized protein ATNIH1004_011286 [Aspergillus tanneri]KAA8642342.1 hypothetical protein ATNIH1004_011286 [Aspergillus tanneri]
MSNAQCVVTSQFLGIHIASVTEACVFVAFTTIAWYNTIELIILCFTTFKKYRGCYFWSLLVASACVGVHALGFLLLVFAIRVSPYLPLTIAVFSWCGMVTGQSLVLWSRLNLVLYHPRVLQVVLLMIITDAILLHTPIIVLLYGAMSSHPQQFTAGYNVVERIQLVGFCLQELIISLIYIWGTIRLLKFQQERHRRHILHRLLIISIIILLLDITVVVVEYAGLYTLQVPLKATVYSIKLKLEYSILGKLVEISRGPTSDLMCFMNGLNSNPLPYHGDTTSSNVVKFGGLMMFRNKSIQYYLGS